MRETEKISREIIENKAFRLLGKREYSVWGLTNKLREKFPNNFEEISKIAKKLVEKDWISDERWTEYVVREKVKYSGWGERKIVIKLRENKISDELIQQNLAKYFSKDVQTEKAKKLAQEKLVKLNSGRKKLTDYEKKQKIKLFLVSRGFSFEIAQTTIENLKKAE